MSYHDSDGGAPEITDFEIVNVEYNYKSKTGKVEISYWVYRYYGCADLNTETDDYESWRFQIDAKNNLLVLNAIDYEPLSPGEEL